MDKYDVKLMPKAERDIDGIYEYLAKNKEIPEIALKLVEEMEKVILSLENLPYRGSERRVGAHANKGYRQIFINNFTILYRVDEKRHFILLILGIEIARLLKINKKLQKICEIYAA